MAVVVGGVQIDLGADAAGVIREMDRAGKQVQRASQQMAQSTSRWRRAFNSAERGIISGSRRIGRSFAGMARSLGSIAGIAGGVGAAGLALMAKRSLESADAIAKAADRAGIGTDAFQALSFQASQTGLSQENLNTAMLAFGRRVAEARKDSGPLISVLKSLNPELLAGIKNSRDNAQALRLVADAMANAENRGQALAIAQAAFSETGRGLVLTFADGASSIDQFAARARELGLILDEDVLRNAEDANDALDVLTRVIGTRFTDAVVRAAPQIANLATQIAEAIPDIIEATKSFGQFIGLLEETRLEQVTSRIQILNERIDAQRRTVDDAANSWLEFFGIADPVESQLNKSLEERRKLMRELLGLMAKQRGEMAATSEAAREANQAAAEAGGREPFGGSPPVPPSVNVAGERIQFRRQQLEEESRRNEARRTAVIPGTGQRVVDDRREAFASFTQQMQEFNRAAEQGRDTTDRIGDSARFSAASGIADMVTEARSFGDALQIANQVFKDIQRTAVRFAAESFLERGVGDFLGLFASRATTTFGAGTIGAGTANLFGTGFQHGGSFTVGGSGGPDSQLVPLRLTPGERVDVTPISEMGGRGEHVEISIDARGADPTVIPRMRQALDQALAEHDARFIDDTARDPRRRRAMNIKFGRR